jgi:hypothetical protein
MHTSRHARNEFVPFPEVSSCSGPDEQKGVVCQELNSSGAWLKATSSKAMWVDPNEESEEMATVEILP